LRPFYSDVGRPIDPELMIRMLLLIGYCFGIRSERRLCDDVHLNLAYRWCCRLGLDGAVPDHSTFSKNRHGRFRDSDLLRELFETTVRRCMAEGLVGGDGFAADASLIKADANKQRSAEGSQEVDWEAMAATGARCGSISTRWILRLGLPPRRSSRSSSRSPIRRRSGPGRSRAMPSSPMPPAIDRS
jgi:transposase